MAVTPVRQDSGDMKPLEEHHPGMAPPPWMCVGTRLSVSVVHHLFLGMPCLLVVLRQLQAWSYEEW